MIFDRRIGMGCWMFAAFFLGLALTHATPTGTASASAFIAAGCFLGSGVVQFAFDSPLSTATDDIAEQG